MGNENAEPDAAKDASEKLWKFLKSKNANRVCPICGNNEWEFLGTSGNYPVLHMESFVQFYKLYSVCCSNCSHVQQFMRHAVDTFEEATNDGATE